MEDSLQRFDELVNVFQTMPGQGEDMMAKRLSKLSVKLLRTCAQINKGLELHEKHIVVIRLLEFLRELPDPETGQVFLRTVVDTFNMEDDTYQAMQLLVNHVEDLDDSSAGTFVLTHEALEGRFGGMVAGLHMEAQNLFLLRAGVDQELRINHEPVPMNAVVMLAPRGKRTRRTWLHVVPQRTGGSLNTRRARRRHGPSKCTTSAIGSKVPILKPFINSALKHARVSWWASWEAAGLASPPCSAS